MSSGSSGKRVIVPEPSRSILCLMRRISSSLCRFGGYCVSCVSCGTGRVLFQEVVVGLRVENVVP
jgi:hypothetical protein